tara:strand:+ start:695 stop:1453 length:759 start_codon:yes stop_codon:yes gene_type:complete
MATPFTLTALNYILRYSNLVPLIDIFRDPNTFLPSHDISNKCRSATLYHGNGLSRKLAYACSDEDNNVSTTYYTNYNIEDTVTLLLKCSGWHKFSILLRPNGNARISTSGTLLQCAQGAYDIEAVIRTEIEFIATLVEKCVPCIVFHNKCDFNILLLNGLYNVSHPFSNSQYCIDFFDRFNVFPHFAAPNFSGSTRRKGMISLFANSSKKNGVIKINHYSFHFMGFSRISTFTSSIKNIDTLILRFNQLDPV